MKSHPKRFNIRRFLQSFLGYWISFQAVKLIFGYVGEMRFSLAQKKSRVESSNFDLCSGSKHDVNSIFPGKKNTLNQGDFCKRCIFVVFQPILIIPEVLKTSGDEVFPKIVSGSILILK